MFDLDQEIRWTIAVYNYILHHKLSDLLKPAAPFPASMLPQKLSWGSKTVDLPQKVWYQQLIKQTYQAYPKLYSRFKHLAHLENIITRYHILQLLSNISLSVSPKVKQQWKIDHELFGAFYNTSHESTYCSLFPDLEPNSQGNAILWKPPSNKSLNILVNPPYTSQWIRWSIKTTLEWRYQHTVYLVIPVWDKIGRHKAHLKPQPYDLPEINLATIAANSYKITKLPFYDGINDQPATLKDPVYVMVFRPI